MRIKPVTFGKSEVVANPLGLGTNAVGGHNLFHALDDHAGKQLVDAAIANGINLLDTAYVYGFCSISYTLVKNKVGTFFR